MADLLCAIPLVASLFAACGTPSPLATGYVEGEYVAVTPLATARIVEIPVHPGDRVRKGAPLAAVDEADAKIALAAAEAALSRAESELANLGEGGRVEELAVIEAMAASAEANAVRTGKEAARQKRLVQERASSQAQYDAAQAAADMAAAAVAEARARLAVAGLPAREKQIEAARAAVREAAAGRDAARWTLDQRRLVAPADGTVMEIVRHAGEIAGPSMPILVFLPEGAIKLRLYVGEGDLAAIGTDTKLAVSCDGCPPLSAIVTHVADEAEFTPPVIYSRDARQKLVYRVEARPDGAAKLKPGQIVEVRREP
ncbi:UNVERIFIED_ORG: HlyD family efflux transporter periplasmic adaptor subunit (plasmid) [Roseateles sp. XES5]|nr:HlyD family efflux transporter periplasmic adaptor subunit [Roseateles sp. XES5]